MTTGTRPRLVKTPRAVLRDRDSLVSTQPRVSHGQPSTGDTTFDDRSTIAFVTGTVNVHYPSGFTSGDPNIRGSQQVIDTTTPGGDYPNWGAGMLATGSVVRSVAGSYVQDIPGSLSSYREAAAYSPFIEQQLHAVESASLDDPFYATGSRVQDVGLGFTQPLWSKTKLEIDIRPSVATTFGYTQTASLALQRPAYTPMVYYNFAGRSWDAVGTPVVAAGLTDLTDEVQSWLSHAPVGFTRGAQLLISATNLACQPCSNFGFPVSPRFHARPDYALPMSGVIDRPFLLEKFAYEVDVEYVSRNGSQQSDLLEWRGDSGLETGENAASILTFFMLNQRSPFSASIDFVTDSRIAGGASLQFTVTASLPDELVLTASGDITRVDTTRDLVTFGQIVSYSGTLTKNDATARTMDEVLQEGLARELNLDVSAQQAVGGATRNTTFSRRRLIMSGTAKQVFRLEREFGWGATDIDGVSTRTISGANVPGGRTSRPMGMTGRDLVASQPGGRLSNTVMTDGDFSQFNPPAEVPVVNSPYLLLPSDNLVFGWQAPHMRSSHQFISGGSATYGPRVTLHPGIGKLTLYGSMVAEQHEFHDTLDQQLTSDAIHETLHYDNPVLDQYDTEPYAQLSGSYVDDIVTGSFTARSVIASNVNVGAPEFSLGVTRNDSLIKISELRGRSRNLTCVDTKELFWDCLFPAPDAITRVNGGRLHFYSPVANTAVISLDFGEKVDVVGTGEQVSLFGDNRWSMSYPFEPVYSSLPRVLDLVKGVSTQHYWNGGTAEPVVGSERYVTAYFIVRPGNHGETGNYQLLICDDVNNDSGIYTPLQQRDFRKLYYGIGSLNTFHTTGSGTYVTGSHNLVGVREQSFAASHGPDLRGWKYGIKNGLHEYSKTVFRRDRFGQFRDMLEQRAFSKYYLVASPNVGQDREQTQLGETSAAVDVLFLSSSGVRVDPYSTDSSNMSTAATASLPYFDAIARNR